MPNQMCRVLVLAITVFCLCVIIYSMQRYSLQGPMNVRKPAHASSKTADEQLVLYQARADKEKQGLNEMTILRQNSYSHSLAGADVDNMTPRQLALTLHSYLDNQDSICRRKIRLGNIEDGGWELCDDTEVRPVPPCIIYSLGAGFDWTFDDDAARLFGCHVISVDPSLKMERHDRSPLVHFYPWGIDGTTEKRSNGWQMYTFADLRKMIGHTNKTIDIVKMDIEHSEWNVIPNMLQTGELDKAGVKQILMEFHVTGTTEDRPRLKMIQAMEKAGWGRFYALKNIHCKRNQEGFPVIRTSCYEVAFYRKSLFKH